MVRRRNVDVLSDQLCVVQGLKGNEKGGNSAPDYTFLPITSRYLTKKLIPDKFVTII
jgi:hypothetical protein